jgi:hypothetical protein
VPPGRVRRRSLRRSDSPAPKAGRPEGRKAGLNPASPPPDRDAPGRHRVVVSTPEHRIDFWGCSGNGVITPRGVAQLGSARRSGRRGRRFKSCHPDSHGPGSTRNQGRSASRDPLARQPLASPPVRTAADASPHRRRRAVRAAGAAGPRRRTTETGPRHGLPRREPVPAVPVLVEPTQGPQATTRRGRSPRRPRRPRAPDGPRRAVRRRPRAPGAGTATAPHPERRSRRPHRWTRPGR